MECGKYKIGDIVEFNEGNGSYIAIKNYGVIKKAIRKGYAIICYSVEDDSEQELYFYDDEIKGIKKGE